MEIKEGIYWVKTRELANKFLEECEKQEIRWNSGEKATEYDEFPYGEETCIKYAYHISLGRKALTYADKNYFKGKEIIEYKGEGNMELKDIVLKYGDVIHFKNGDKIEVLGWDGYKVGIIGVMGEKGKEIIKIERPTKYETIYETPKEILDKEEKKYLEAVIKPFKDRVVNISKWNNSISKKEFICIEMQYEKVDLPFFKAGTMYKGMEPNKEYTLEELGLFKE